MIKDPETGKKIKDFLLESKENYEGNSKNEKDSIKNKGS